MNTGWMAVLVATFFASIGSVQGAADLSLSASGPGGGEYAIGENLTFNLSITNLGPSEATDVVVSNPFPVGLTFVSATGGSLPTNGVLLLNLGTLAAGSATNSIQIVEQPNLSFPAQSLGQPLGHFTNLFQVYGDETDPETNNNSAIWVTAVLGAVPGTPVAWTNLGGGSVSYPYTDTGTYSGPPRPIDVGEVGDPATTCQPGDIVLLTQTNNYGNPTNWAAVLSFFNPADPMGTNNLAATFSQAFFATNSGGDGFTNVQLMPVVSFILEGLLQTTNDLTTIQAGYNEFGPADAILGGQEDIDTIVAYNSTVSLTITRTNDQAIVSWPKSISGWTLQTNNDLTTGTWGDYAGSVTNNIVTNAPPQGDLFFRLTPAH